MISLRRRLLYSVLSAVVLVWFATAAWFVFEVREEARDFLDVRLVDSAEMVRALLNRGDLLQADAGQAPAAPRAELDAAAPGALACQIWSEHGQLLALSSGAPEAQLADLESGFSNREIGGAEWRVYTLAAPEQGVRILVAEQRELRRELIRDIAVGMLVPFVLLAPLVAGLVWFGIDRGLRPLERLGRALERRDPDRLDAIPPDPIPREARPLIASLNRLFARLQRAFERERQFTADAAHELRTPLAALKTHVQVARAAREPAARDKALAYVETATDRAAHLVDALLTLARLESEDQADGFTTAPARVVDEVLSELSPLAAARGVTLRVLGADALPALAIPASALAVALRNLLENALLYGGGGEPVMLRCTVEATSVRCEVLDAGPGIPEAELTQVRERFHRGSTAQGHGSGLGLSIVERIVARHGCTFTLANRPTGGLVASLRVPRADGA